MPTSVAAQLCGLNARTLRRWARHGAIKPTAYKGRSVDGLTYGWTLRDIVAGRAIKQLRQRVSEKHLRAVVRALERYDLDLASAVLVADPRERQVYQVLSTGDYMRVLDGQLRAVALAPIVKAVMRSAEREGYKVSFG